MADADADEAAAIKPEQRRTRPASSLTSTEAGDDEAAVSKKAILLLASPSPSRPAGRLHPLEPAPPKRRAPPRRSRPVRMFESMCRSLPLFNPTCGRQTEPGAPPSPDSLFSQLTSSASAASPGGGPSSSSRRRLTGTLFGYRNCRVSLALQDNARCMPDLVVELAIPTHVLLRELNSVAGARIVLESEKRCAASSAGAAARGAAGHYYHRWRNNNTSSSDVVDDVPWVLEEPMWTMFCNGKRVGYAVRREPNDVDIEVLETLWGRSMGGGVLPSVSDGLDGEMAYMRGGFDHTVGSRDSESLYMVGPPGGDCPDLAIFFVRI